MPYPGYGRPAAPRPPADPYLGYGAPPTAGQPTVPGQPAGYGQVSHGPPPTMMFAAPAAPAPKWKSWHKQVLGVLGVLTLCVCGVALFAPDQDTDKTADSPEAAALQQSASTTPQTATATPKVEATTTAKPTRTTTKPKPSPSRTASKSPKAVYYANCDAAPGELGRTDPGYRKGLDRDGDGVACESSGDDEEPIEDDDGTDPRYKTCAAANDAGLGPYRRGVDPEYEWYQDRDGDGVVCET